LALKSGDLCGGNGLSSGALTATRFVATNLSRDRKNNNAGESDQMILEMRVYRCIPGRLPALLKRFDTLTLKLWDKHGIKQAGFYTTLIGTSNQELTYFLAWDSLADREKKWTAFQSDPDWLAGRARSEEDGQIIDNIVSQLLVPTAFSAVK
jgi:NIPSNAP